MPKSLEELSPDDSLNGGDFKTSPQGRKRRAALVQALRELLREHPPESLTFAKICEHADIPRASAYHFFPNMGALYLGLRLVHAELVAERLSQVDTSQFESWQDYVYFLAAEAIAIVREDPAMMRVVYGVRNEETMHIGKELDSKIASIALRQVMDRFALPSWPDAARKVGIAVALIDSVFRYSFREQGEITDEMVREAGRAAVAYLRCYLPEYVESRV
ncbi:transcriptional regulator, TetR family [Leptospira broomii serovar Hurstbridge str. 5399]|uniref:Transcriptional regulator, TetR family n=1 Tax=Leptospira broomii serovar Hurstbridge str. 5399 TaxID=1049789 RepID=T0F6I2_9LEPT|nr:TetR/AcrR family transcriptional regulator [Leptospira broomii]EQA46745.1 transcriptional regulator, TetR family [Leptospira broomii serovar Hurstbridge str. 5399]